VGVSERDLSEAGLGTEIYYALGLFVLGGLDLGMPQGGPALARLGLWFAFFLAPLVTTLAAIEGVLRALRPQLLQARGLRGHVVVVGLGRLGILYLEALRELEPEVPVLVVSLEAEGANVVEATARLGARHIQGDITHRTTRGALGLERARGVVLATNRDLTNLEAAWDLLDDCPSVRVAVHVSNIGMRRGLSRLVDRGETRVLAFNSHRIAARRLWGQHLEKRFEGTAGRDLVVLAGFGRFGQTILEYIQDKAGAELGTAVVVDHHARVLLQQFEQEVATRIPYRSIPVEGDVDEPATWEKVTAELDEGGPEPVYVIGVDDDTTNLRVAARICASTSAPVFVRCFHSSRFVEEMAAEFDFVVLSADNLLRDALRENHAIWFVETSS